jgi:chromosome segregation protein
MHLRSLKLVGFKSFGDRTRLELRPGVTVIVGPNGSGKSNIVEAVAWVMGSQAPRAMRTARMEEVIFAGTATRPGLGRAEVTLVLDNAAGLLPMDVAEVSITRRLYRDGSSDYEINGVPCRLLDIQEMLSDAGVGRHQHVIVGQGQVDSVLNATPEDHRAVIEEAAGILKHRLRKEKSIRRLEHTEGDVLRLTDLLGELARQMRPLKRQAEAAARHAGVAAEVRGLRLFLGGEELRGISARRAQVAGEETSLREAVTGWEAEAEELGAALRSLGRDAGEVGEALDRDTSAAARLETTMERLRRIAQVAQERHRAGLARLEGAAERRGDLEAEREELSAQLVALRERLGGEQRLAEDAERRFRTLEDEERSLADQEAMTTEGAIAVVRGDLRALDAAGERESIRARLAVLAAQTADERAESARLNDEIRRLDAVVSEAQSRYTAGEAERRRHQEAWERAEAAHTDARVALAAVSARLEAVEQAASGPADPEARRLVEAAPGALGTLSSRLDVPADLAAAVDAALGPWAGAIAFGGPEALAAVVGALKGAGRGGVPVVAARSGEGRAPAREAASRGLEALIDRLGPACDRALAEQLLGDVVIAEGWAAAWRAVARDPRLRAVTPEGDLIATAGVRVAHPDGATPAMLEAAAVAVEAAERDLARAASLRTQARRAFDEARLVERDALETLESLEAGLAGSSEALARLGRALTAAEQERVRLEERVGAIGEAEGDRQEQRRRLTERLAALEGEEAERQRAWDELTARRRSVAGDRERARAAWQEATSARRATEERVAMVAARLEAVAGTIAGEREHPEDPGRLARLAAIEAAARRALAACRVHTEELRRRQAELRSRAGETGVRLGEAQAALDQAHRRVAGAKERLGALAVEAAELRVRAEAAAEALRRDVDASEEEALVAPQPEVEGDPEAALAARQAELRRMGPVNPLAAEEYAALTERHTFLAAQLEDLERSRRELRKVIEALDGEIQSRFLAAFDEIAGAYEQNFSVLFPGGKGRVRLSDPAAPLTSGVEIEAQPFGKKVAKMSLLSGGERSLAALAFLFAVFKSRPSPFYLLDEVEAALDDANLRRFLRLLESFRGDAQLLIVTHQQQTMEVADVLYGVTMEPGGSSQVVAKPLAVAVEA